ncbi:unnamed protein product [Prorocentrum cordatum]|uniref:SWIM-type domain-containing protein n=1 Tax=Prorocentrum cordatum TaxID=2364126 RepID=A0ABN9V0R3_9DINO|nr:unnamed protein product [Polarella glacialis]
MGFPAPVWCGFAAIALLKVDAVSILIRCADGSVQASVKSERGSEEYAVRTGPPGGAVVTATCSCHDFRRRGGLCKHGAAVALMAQREQVGMAPRILHEL